MPMLWTCLYYRGRVRIEFVPLWTKQTVHNREASIFNIEMSVKIGSTVLILVGSNRLQTEEIPINPDSSPVVSG